MRTHLTKRHEAEAAVLNRRQGLLDELRGSADPEHSATILQELHKTTEAHVKVKKVTNEWQCSHCKKLFPQGEHVAVQINNVTAKRGANKPPLIKDYRPDNRPMLYACFACALAIGYVTEKELETGIREGRFLKG